MQETKNYWEPEEVAQIVFESIGITQASKHLQTDLLSLLRLQQPNHQLDSDARQIAEDKLSTSITKFIKGEPPYYKSKHIRLNGMLIDQEVDFQKNEAIGVLLSTPLMDRNALASRVIRGLIMRDHDFLIRATGRGSQSADSFASFLRNILLNQHPFPLHPLYTIVGNQLHEFWSNPQNQKELGELDVYVDFDNLTNCDIEEGTYSKRLTHIKQIWENKHPDTAFQIYD